MKPLIYGQSCAKTKLYRVWAGMKTRCTNPNADNYGRYGGKGIKYCEGFKSFLVFKNALGEPPTSKHTVDRARGDLHYSCGACDECIANGWGMNVKWATYKEQSLNRDTWVHDIEYNGEGYSLTDLAEKLGVSRLTLSNRINEYGWSIEKALSVPIKKRDNTISDLAKQSGISYQTLRQRIELYKWDIIKAISTPVRKSKRVYANNKTN